MGPSVRNANHLELGSDLLEVTWLSRWDEPGGSAKRSEIQKVRHATDPAFHERALRNLEKGRNEWQEDQILDAIRSFRDRMGRPPKYEELRSGNGLPDYKTVWRKFGSSKTAIERALA